MGCEVDMFDLTFFIWFRIAGAHCVGLAIYISEGSVSISTVVVHSSFDPPLESTAAPMCQIGLDYNKTS